MKKKLCIVMAMIFLIAQLTAMGGISSADVTADDMGAGAGTDIEATTAGALDYVPTDEDWLSKVAFPDGLHKLGVSNTGLVNIEFDFIPLDNTQDSNIGFADSSVTVDSFKKLSMIIAYEIGAESVNFIVRNGGVYQCDQPVPVINNQLYHFRIAANLAAQTYSVYVTPDGGIETAIATNYKFRLDPPAMDDVGQLVMQSAVDNAFAIKNHYINRWPSKIAFTEGLHGLGGGNTGTVNIAFDFVPLDNTQDSNIGYADSSVTVDSFKKLSMIIAYDIGTDAVNFIVRNGSAYLCDQPVPVVNNKKYHFRIVANLAGQTYSVFVTTEGGAETAIATNYKFRLDPPAMDDVGQLILQSAVDNAFFITNHTIQGTDPKAELIAAITSALELAANARVGTSPLNPGEVLQSDLATFVAAIAAAQAVVDDTAAGASEVSSALLALTSAVSTFTSAIQQEIPVGETGCYVIAKTGDADYLTSDYADDTACIQAALNEVPSGSRIFIRTGVYNITRVIYQAGKDLEITGIGDAVFKCITNQPESIAFSGSVVGSARMLVQDAIQGTYDITLDNGVSIRAGDLIKINNSDKWCPDDNNYKNQLTGEMYMVKSVSGNTVTITQPLMRNYLISSASKAAVYRPVKMRIDNIKFIQGVAGGSTGKKDGLTLEICKESSLINCKFEDFGRVSVKISKCFDVQVSGCTIRNANMVGNGYGIDIMDASAGIRIVNNYIENCRHCITSGAIASDIGLNRGIVISDNIIIGSKITDANVIDSHQCTIDYTITNNIIYCYSNSTTQFAAFYDGTQQSTFSNNQVYGGVGVRQRGNIPGGIHVISNNRVTGGSLYRGTNNCAGESIIITGNDVRNSPNVGIFAIGKTFKQYNITDNTIYNCAGDGITLSLSSVITDDANAVISSNNISKVGGNGISVIRESSDDVLDCVITGNIIKDANQSGGDYFGIRLQDIFGAIVSDNIVKNSNGLMAAGIGEAQLLSDCNWNYIHSNYIIGASDVVSLLGNKSIDKDNFSPSRNGNVTR